MIGAIDIECNRCGHSHRYPPGDCTITLERRPWPKAPWFWLNAACPDRAVPLRIRLAVSSVAPLRDASVVLDPDVLDHLKRKEHL